MAFIVEMFWGRPPQLIVEGLDDEGESFVKNVIQVEDPPDPEWRQFSCSGFVWRELLKLGEEYGWKPMGTVPHDSSKRDWQRLGNFKNDYEPRDFLFMKRFLTEDASALADALSRTLEDLQNGAVTLVARKNPVLLRSGMTQDEYHAANRGISAEFLKEFIAFLRKGTFGFAWDD
jgi:hypothetical protein